ncbi:unnamed protein product [Lepeophtheirus salmonis]|uniref:(salmon louse) hypothetical protein n=1 Tax=Lepeophtheirus salmonis TaxID=72036 RepID=A0A7R8CRV2_LEPSM|nr:unnamed protein product [Lepeophtheirus salmonis]CAF2906231.1 unnamed protein product [Lepeophtheirus salmonis]
MLATKDISHVCQQRNRFIASNLVEILGPLETVTLEFSRSDSSTSCILSCTVVLHVYWKFPLVPERLTKVKPSWKRLWRPVHQILPLKLHRRSDSKRLRTEDRGPSFLDSLCNTVLLPSTGEAVEPEGIIEELQRYLREPVIDRKSGNPYDWCKHNTNRFTRLSALARQYLSCPPSSVASERVFSTIGNIYKDRRSSLKGDNAEKLCFLYYNLPLLDWCY